MERQDIPSGFSAVNQANDPKSFVGRLDTSVDIFGPSKRLIFLEEAGRAGKFFAAFTMFIVSGTKPG